MVKKRHTVSRLDYIGGRWTPVRVTCEVSEITPDHIARLENNAVSHALRQLHKFGVTEPLLYQLEQGNPAILRNQEAVQIITKAATGKGVKGKGRKQSPATAQRDRMICHALQELRELGYPIKGDLEVETACRLLARRVALSEEQVYTIWNARIRESECAVIGDLRRSTFYLRQRLENPTWVPSSPEDVLEAFFPIRQAESEENYSEDLEALGGAFYRIFAERVISAIKRRPGNRWGL
ncbi:hypothetical protein ACK8QS_20550 [Ectopseudomonas mendocina]